MNAGARELRERPYQAEADQRVIELAADKGTMPKGLPALLEWYARACDNETPTALHGSQVWRDRLAGHELAAGQQPVGASDTGAPAYDDEFRRRLENGPSEIDRADHDTSGRVFFLRPVDAALARIERKGKPLMKQHLKLLASAGFDWRVRADRLGWAHEEYEVYIREALIMLWREFREWVRSD